MKLVDTEETVVLVTGTSPTAEERDRPLAERLKAEIDRRGAGHAYRRAVVVGDASYLEHRIFHLNPTIAIGGPGANGVTANSPPCSPPSTAATRGVRAGGFRGGAQAGGVVGRECGGHGRSGRGVQERQGCWRSCWGGSGGSGWGSSCDGEGPNSGATVYNLQPEQIRQRPVHHLRRIPVNDLPQHVHGLEGQALRMDPVTLVAHDVPQRDGRDPGLVPSSSSSPSPPPTPRRPRPARWSPTAPPPPRPLPPEAAPSRRADTAGPGGAARATSTTCTGSSKIPY